MFEKLFMLVKNNAGKAVVNNPVIPVQYHEAVINEASSSIIEVLKWQMESGKLKDMVKYFQFPDLYNNNPLINGTITKFANKLNNYYGIEPAAAVDVAKKLMVPTMQALMQQSTEKNNDFALGKLLGSLSGNKTGMDMLLSQLAIA